MEEGVDEFRLGQGLWFLGQPAYGRLENSTCICEKVSNANMDEL